MKRETQDALGCWFYPSQNSRIGFFLGMESGSDVKFFSLGSPVWPLRWESMRKWEMRPDGGTRAEKFHITAWLHTQKEPYSAIQIIFKKYEWILARDKTNAVRHPGLPFRTLNRTNEQTLWLPELLSELLTDHWRPLQKSVNNSIIQTGECRSRDKCSAVLWWDDCDVMYIKFNGISFISQQALRRVLRSCSSQIYRPASW